MCLNNILEALELLDQHDSYCFMVEQVILIKEFWETYPEKRAELTKHIKSGRFGIGGGMYCMPYMNIIYFQGMN